MWFRFLWADDRKQSLSHPCSPLLWSLGSLLQEHLPPSERLQVRRKKEQSLVPAVNCRRSSWANAHLQLPVIGQIWLCKDVGGTRSRLSSLVGCWWAGRCCSSRSQWERKLLLTHLWKSQEVMKCQRFIHVCYIYWKSLNILPPINNQTLYWPFISM